MRGFFAPEDERSFGQEEAFDYGSEGCVFESRRVHIKSQSRSAGEKILENGLEFRDKLQNSCAKICDIHFTPLALRGQPFAGGVLSERFTVFYTILDPGE